MKNTLRGGAVTVGRHFDVKKGGRKGGKEGGKLVHLSTTQEDIPPPKVNQWRSKVMQKYRIACPVRMNLRKTEMSLDKLMKI